MILILLFKYVNLQFHIFVNCFHLFEKFQYIMSFFFNNIKKKYSLFNIKC